MPPTANTTGTGARHRRPHPRVLDQCPPRVAAGPADPRRPARRPNRVRGHDVRPDPRVVGRQAALGPVIGQRVRQHEQDGARPGPVTARRGRPGHLGGGVPHVEAPRSALRVPCRSAAPSWCWPARRTPASVSTGRSSSAAVSAAISPPCATRTTGSIAPSPRPLVDQFAHHRHAARGDVDPALAARAVRRSRRRATPRARPGTRVVDLEMGQALPRPEVRLAQPLIGATGSPAMSPSATAVS